MMVIENFLQVILQNEKIINNPDLVLNYLNLPLDFYNYVNEEIGDKFIMENKLEEEKNNSKIEKKKINISPNLRMSTSCIIEESRKTIKGTEIKLKINEKKMVH